MSKGYFVRAIYEGKLDKQQKSASATHFSAAELSSGTPAAVNL